MLPADVMRQVRRLQVRARRAVQTLLGGEYHSAFKGAGLVFEEVREYLPGDDTRTIDWNVTARMGHPFIKRYVEERELTILLVVDLSASQQLGSDKMTKRAVAAELAALIAFAAIGNNDRVGLLGFTDRVERHIRPNKGTQHVLRLLREILFYEPERHGTDLAMALDTLNKTHRRRGVVFLLSDFLTTGYEGAFRRAARQHDLIAVRMTDPLEEQWPNVGLVQLQDAETGQPLLIDTSNAAFRETYSSMAQARQAALADLVRSANADLIEARTDGNHFDVLVNFFRIRERQRRGP